MNKTDLVFLCKQKILWVKSDFEVVLFCISFIQGVKGVCWRFNIKDMRQRYSIINAEINLGIYSFIIILSLHNRGQHMEFWPDSAPVCQLLSVQLTETTSAQSCLIFKILFVCENAFPGHFSRDLPTEKHLNNKISSSLSSFQLANKTKLHQNLHLVRDGADTAWLTKSLLYSFYDFIRLNQHGYSLMTAVWLAISPFWVLLPYSRLWLGRYRDCAVCQAVNPPFGRYITYTGI